MKNLFLSPDPLKLWKFKAIIFTLFLTFVSISPTMIFADNNTINGTCPGETIEQIDGTTVSVSHTEDGAVGGGGNDRYRMTFLVGGTLDISAINRDLSRNENYNFYVSRNSCGDDDADWNIVSKEYGKSHSATLTVNPNDTIYIRLQSIVTEPNSGRHNYSLSLDFTRQNNNPTNITLNPADIDELQNIGTVIGTLTTADLDVGDTHTYTLTGGTGDSDNSSFTISGTDLLSNEIFNFETKTSYSIRVQSDDGNSGTFEKKFTITINNINEIPDINSDGGGNTAIPDPIEINVGNTSITTVTVVNTNVLNTLASSNNTDFTFNAVTGELVLTNTPVATDIGNTYSTTITASGDDGDDTQVINVIIADVPLDFTCANPSDFNIAYQTNDYGNIKLIGNTNICKMSNGHCIDPGTATNNSIVAQYKDGDSDNSTINSSAAKLELPDGASILWAGMYWQGYFDAGKTGGAFNDTVQNRSRFIKLGYSGADTTSVSYNTVTADTLNWIYFSSRRWYYQGFSEITNEIKGEGWYWGADINLHVGATVDGGSLGAWSIAVVYKDNNDTVKNMTIYKGYLAFAGDNDVNNARTYAATNSCDTSNTGVQKETSFTLSGFRTPSSGDVNSTLILFAGEGDIGLSGDGLSITDNGGSSETINNSVNNATNLLNSSISKYGVHVGSDLLYPRYGYNTIGIDIDTFNVSDIIGHNQTSTDVRMYTSGDGYFPGGFGLSTELYVPSLCYDYTLDIDGHVIDTVENNIVTSFGGFGKPLTTHAYIRSLEGDLDLTDFNITYRIDDTTHLTYQSGSSGVSEFGDYDYDDASSWTKNIGTSGFTMYLGDGKTSTSGGTIRANEERYIRWESDFVKSTVNTSFDFAAQFTVDYGSGAVHLIKNFNSVDDLCPGGGGSYEPSLGLFNLVDNSSNHDIYNLHTQVAGRAFDLNLYAHDPANLSNLTPTDLNLSVEIEFVRVDHFVRDANTTCGDKDARLPDVASKFAHIDGNNVAVTYTAADMNFAYRNLAMRVKYLANADGTLIDNHRCSDLNQTACENLYARDALSGCNTECAVGGSGCYSCLMNNYGRLTCSRDNFSVRPETYIINIIDSDQSTDTTKPSNSIAVSKQITGTANSGNLIADYDYRFDINATSHTSDVNVSHYVQVFNSPDSPRSSARMSWFPDGRVVSGCNDPDDKNISVTLFNGTNVNYARNTAFVDSVNQIGKYQFSIVDEDWTRADWDPTVLGHHAKYASNFPNPIDCITNSSTVTLATNDVQQGCQINSVHSNPNGGTYTNLDMTYYPYAFNVAGLQVGLGPQQETAVGVNDFIYMNTPNADDENMSLNIYGTFLAAGYNGEKVENFVTNCYAQDVNMFLAKQDNTGEFLSYDLIDYNQSNIATVIRPRSQSIFTAVNPSTILQDEAFFVQDMQGAITMDLSYNYDRNISIPVDPRLVQFQDFNITLASNPSISVDLITNYQVFGDINLDSNISFVYGRLHAPRYRVEGAAGQLQMYYEVFCSTCSSSSLNWGGTIGQESVDSINWYQNPAHDNDLLGDISNFIPKNDSKFSQSLAYTRDRGDFTYSGTKYPYKTTIDINTSDWLLYDKYNSTATVNYFELEFNNAVDTWNTTDDGAKVDSDAAINTNRRIMW